MTDILHLSYGPRGATILASALLTDLRADLDESENIDPLSTGDFFLYVVVPHAAFLVMCEDLSELEEEVVREVMAASADYGRLFHSEDNEADL